MPKNADGVPILGPDFTALQVLIDHCREGDLYEDYDRAATVVADAQVALRNLWAADHSDGNEGVSTEQRPD